VERPDAPVRLVRVGGSKRRTAVSISVAVILVAAAVAKPWAGPATRPNAGAPIVGPASGAAAAAAVRAAQSSGDPGAGQASVARPLDEGTSGPSAGGSTTNRPAQAAPCCTTPGAAVLVEEGGMPICYAPDGWRVVADEEASGVRSRIWIPVAARVAAGPADPGVPLAHLVASRVTALGFCAPVDAVPVVARTAILWSDLPAAAPAANRYVPVAALRAAPRADGALADATPGRAAWPPGRYVVEVLNGARGVDAAWFGLVLTAPAS
jgi:hypothetical protein